MTKYLFFSDNNEKTRGDVSTVICSPSEVLPVVKRTFAHENFISLYTSFIYDVDYDEYRIYYIVRDKKDVTRLAVALSKDLVSWEKPQLCFEIANCESANNLLGIRAADSAVFYDVHAPKEERYKHIVHYYKKGLFVNTSADGLHWDIENERLFSPTFHDGHNMAVWDFRLNKYRLYLRGWDGKPLSRVALTTECDSLSDGLLQYNGAAKRRNDLEQPYLSSENLRVALSPSDFGFPNTDIYTLPVSSYPESDIFVAFPALYHHVDLGLENDGIVESAFCSSEDGVKWNCHNKGIYAKTGKDVNMAYMGAGIHCRGDYMYSCGCIYKTRHGEVERRRNEGDGEIVLYKQQKDRYISKHFGKDGGELTLPSLTLSEEITFNFKGTLSVQIIDGDNTAVDRFFLNGDSISHTESLPQIRRDKEYSLVISGKNAELFALYI